MYKNRYIQEYAIISNPQQLVQTLSSANIVHNKYTFTDLNTWLGFTEIRNYKQYKKS